MKKERKRFLLGFETTAKKDSERGKKYTKTLSKMVLTIKHAQKGCLTGGLFLCYSNLASEEHFKK